ncbi:MAG TPA: oxygenase MpaB family protein [Rhodoblastus sp.]|nr:oxygenase MpaB family protein [Rhodoblastus sp.]
MRDFDALIDRGNAAYSARYSRALLDRMMFVSDPLADRAVAALHERNYDRTADKLSAVRALAAEGDEAARAFVEAVSVPPDWLDRKAIAAGQNVMLGFVGLSRLSLMHSLFAGGVFARATLVTRATGRLGANPATRISETGAFIAAILQPGGLEPGALGHETTLRVRLLHSSIRAWLKRMPDFERDFVGEPIDQTMLAMTLGLFSYLNLRSFARLGVRFSDGENEALQHLWRYVGWLLGIDDALLARSLRQERELWSALVAHQAFAGDWGRQLLDESVRTAAALTPGRGDMQPFFRSVFMLLSGPAWFGTQDDARLDAHLRALRTANAAQSLWRRWAPGQAGRMAAAGLEAFGKSVHLARAHRFEVKIETPEENARAEAALKAVGAAVRKRFAHLAAT